MSTAICSERALPASLPSNPSFAHLSEDANRLFRYLALEDRSTPLPGVARWSDSTGLRLLSPPPDPDASLESGFEFRVRACLRAEGAVLELCATGLVIAEPDCSLLLLPDVLRAHLPCSVSEVPAFARHFCELSGVPPPMPPGVPSPMPSKVPPGVPPGCHRGAILTAIEDAVLWAWETSSRLDFCAAWREVVSHV